MALAMAMATTVLYFSLGLLLLSRASLAQYELGEARMSGSPFEGQGRRLGSRGQCRIERLSAQEPRRRVESEAGFTEYFDENDETFDCAGVSVFRRTVRPGGLAVPSFFTSPILAYVLQGRGIFSNIITGPETYQSFEQGQGFGDQHERIHHFKEGDVIAIPAGVVFWCYNDGQSPVVIVGVMDVSNHVNQLDRHGRQFLLAGQQQSGSQPSGGNILAGFDTQMLAEAMDISRELAEMIQSHDDRGSIVQVRGELEVLRPSSSSRRESEEYGNGKTDGNTTNGVEVAACCIRMKENIRDPTLADVYNPKAGRMTDLNSQKLPILRFLRLSAEYGSLRKNAIRGPNWNVNAHSVMYVIRGSSRCQVVDNQGRTVFDGELRRGQFLVVPQYFAVLNQASSSDDDFEWIAIKTNDNSMVGQIVGRGSAFMSTPVDVLMNSFGISREEAMMAKGNRGQEVALFSPRSQREASA